MFDTTSSNITPSTSSDQVVEQPAVPVEEVKPIEIELEKLPQIAADADQMPLLGDIYCSTCHAPRNDAQLDKQVLDYKTINGVPHPTFNRLSVFCKICNKFLHLYDSTAK